MHVLPNVVPTLYVSKECYTSHWLQRCSECRETVTPWLSFTSPSGREAEKQFWALIVLRNKHWLSYSSSSTTGSYRGGWIFCFLSACFCDYSRPLLGKDPKCFFLCRFFMGRYFAELDNTRDFLIQKQHVANYATESCFLCTKYIIVLMCCSWGCQAH